MSGPIIPRTFATAGINTPGAWLDQDYEAIRAWIDDRNPTAGPIASRPSPGNAGALYLATDSGNLLYLDDGAAWQLIAANWDAAWPGASSLDFSGIATPTTPAAGHSVLFLPNSGSGLNRLSIVDSAGQIRILSSLIARETGAPIKDIVNTVTETSLLTTAFTIKGGTIGTNRGLRVTVGSDYLNNSGSARSLTIRFKYGGTTFGTVVTASLDNSGNRQPLYYSEMLVGTGSEATQFGATGAQLNDPGTTNAMPGSNTLNSSVFSGNVGAVDTSADQTLDVTAQHDNANANQSVRPYWLLVELL